MLLHVFLFILKFVDFIAKFGYFVAEGLLLIIFLLFVLGVLSKPSRSEHFFEVYDVLTLSINQLLLVHYCLVELVAFVHELG